MGVILNFEKWNTLNEAVLNEDFKAENGVTYKLTFKSQQAFDDFITYIAPKRDQVQSPWVKKDSAPDDDSPAGMKANQIAVDSQLKWAETRKNIIMSLWSSWAYVGAEPKVLKFPYARTSALAVLDRARTGTQPNIATVTNSSNAPFRFFDGYEAVADKRFDTLITDPKDSTGKTKITYWQHFMETYIVPNIAAKQALIVPKPAAPVKAATPGTTAPVKKN